MMSIQRLTMTVHNQPGALAQITELISQNGFNIDKINAAVTSGPAITRLRMDLSIGDDHIDRMMSQLSALTDVIQVIATRRRQISLTRLQFGARTSFWFIAFSLFITILGANLPTPLYALYRMKWNLSPVMITLLFASYALIVIPTIILVGQAAERWGRKKLLVPALLCSLSASIGFMYADGIWELIAARVLQGLSIGLFNGVAVAALMAFLPREKLGKVAVVLAIATICANAAAPLIAGGLGQYSQSPLVFTFALHIALVLVCLIGMLFLPETHLPALLKAPLRKPHIPQEMRTVFLRAATATFLAWAILGLLLSIIPSYMNDIARESNLLLSGGMVALVLSMSGLSQFLLRKAPHPSATLIGYMSMLLGLAALIGAVATHSLLLLLLMSILIGLGHGPLYSSSLGRLNANTPDRYRTGVMCLFYAVSYTGVSVPILGLGVAAQRIGLTPAIYGFATVMGMFIIIRLIRGRS